MILSLRPTSPPRGEWKIELFFKWIKQNLRIKRFLAKKPKAIRLQIITALIAHVLLKNCTIKTA